MVNVENFSEIKAWGDLIASYQADIKQTHIKLEALKIDPDTNFSQIIEVENQLQYYQERLEDTRFNKPNKL